MVRFKHIDAGRSAKGRKGRTRKSQSPQDGENTAVKRNPARKTSAPDFYVLC